MNEKLLDSDALSLTKYWLMSNAKIREVLDHDALHSMVVQDIEELRKVYPNPPSEMMDKWDYDHKKYVEKSAWIKQMLTL